MCFWLMTKATHNKHHDRDVLNTSRLTNSVVRTASDGLSALPRGRHGSLSTRLAPTAVSRRWRRHVTVGRAVAACRPGSHRYPPKNLEWCAACSEAVGTLRARRCGQRAGRHIRQRRRATSPTAWDTTRVAAHGRSSQFRTGEQYWITRPAEDFSAPHRPWRCPRRQQALSAFPR